MNFILMLKIDKVNMVIMKLNLQLSYLKDIMDNLEF